MASQLDSATLRGLAFRFDVVPAPSIDPIGIDAGSGDGARGRRER